MCDKSMSVGDDTFEKVSRVVVFVHETQCQGSNDKHTHIEVVGSKRLRDLTARDRYNFIPILQLMGLRLRC